ncbi:virulence factor [Legionella sp. km772]|nr:virulence factor [Legionella sp. km772]
MTSDAGSESPENSSEGLEARKLEMLADLNDPVALVERVYQLWWNWADFHIYVVSPHIESISPPIIIEPEQISDDEVEFVYSIQDRGDKLSTSKSEDMFNAGKSMCKLFYTIEKMISILIERLKTGGIDNETEVQIAFGGHQIAQRKAFESIINLSYNVVVTNFDPGKWGEDYLQIVKRIADKGFGYPSETPRQPYKQSHKSPGSNVIRN